MIKDSAGVKMVVVRVCTMVSGSDTSPSYEHLTYRVEDDVLAIEFNRPEKYNALSDDLLGELTGLFNHVAPTLDVRCVTIKGSGEAFSAGADIGGFDDLDTFSVASISSAMEAVHDFERPVIAVIDGYCLGAGLELALACDFRIATEDSMFGTPETGLGILPGAGGTQRLLRLVGPARAKELVYRGMQIDGETAEDWGLVNHAVPERELGAEVDAVLGDITSAAPLALEMAKKVLNHGSDAGEHAALLMESQANALLMETRDAAEGADAFREGREPEFEGK